MNAQFKEWLIKDAEKWTLKEKQNFLKMTISDPKRVLEIIKENLENWASAFAVMEKCILTINLDSDPKDLFEAYKTRFADDLAAMK